ncbi:quinone oxidoreductase family protein [Jiangella rhizosphaerae]|uniref:NADP-dependent oxidoreductase n=1 Tax=Jiangella rhizosphaerae TaxID=2293569 RepID=A0A418KY71_9ACTN|nr:NADP-dependent oxidoreductase [Jiangella rhizosphaerae]RIQ36933.1 NADP-dependent oxidoreductase [Jiangella rhizosphaerae]
MDSRVETTADGAISEPRMNAVVLDRFGGVEELSSRRIPLPEVGDDDVLIRVEFAGAASWDAVEREGGYDGEFGVASTFPYVLGWDAAGTVTAVGRHVTRFEVGERVYATTNPVKRGGFYAEYGVVEAEFVARVPERLPTAQAGAMPWDALTALSGLDRLGLRPDGTLMVFGASGGIGHMAVQLARHSGIRVLAVASGDDGVALARRLGADHVVDGRRDDVLAAAHEFAPGGLDAALVTAGGEIADRSLRAVKESGRIAVPNGVHPMPVTPPRAMVSSYDADTTRAATDRLNAIIETSAFEVHVARTFPLERVQDAHRALNDHYVGKLALEVG